MVENREERMRVDAKLSFSSDGCSMELLMPVKTCGFCKWLGLLRERKDRDESRRENGIFSYLGTKLSFRD